MPTDPMLGLEIAGRYRIDRVAGDSRSSRIYAGVDQRTEHPVAVRLLFGEFASVPRRCLEFAREARIAALFDHPNVLTAYEGGYTEAGLPYVVTEYIDGRTLDALICEGAPFGAQRTAAFTRQLCAGLDHVHGRGVVHRNLSASNVLVTPTDQVLITGFRLSLHPDDGPASFVETSSRVSGSVRYLAPERLAGGSIDQRADLFSLGVIVYQMLSGMHPFDGSPLEVGIHNRSRPVPPIDERAGVAADPALESIAVKLMAKQPGDRYSTAADVLVAVEGAVR